MKNKIFSLFLALAMLLSLAIPAFAQSDEDIVRLVDEADVISSSEERRISKLLDETSAELSFDIIIVTLDSHRGDIDLFTESYYDEIYGPYRDGVILLLSMQERDVCISGCGEGKEIFDSYTIDTVLDSVALELSEDEYAAGFEVFVEQTAYHVDGYRNGYPFDPVATLLIAAVAGLIVALIVTLIFKGQLKSVRRQLAAQNYVKQGSMRITKSHDLFLYKTVSRTKKANTSSSGGSSNHSTGSRKF